jgi:hypothetical protein
MTNKPHRLKPIDIYTHWYTATKLASISAVDKVYNWVLTQSITPIYVADYGHIANNFFTIHLAREGNGFWIGGAEALRELRMPTGLGTPEIANSQGIAGYNPSPNGNIYVHMDGSSSVYLALGQSPKPFPYIISANAPIAAFTSENMGFTAKLKGYVPVQVQMGNVQNCRARMNGQATTIPANGQLQSTAHDVTLHVSCSQ